MISLACRKSGSGDPLILLHGNGGESTDFEHQTDYFSSDFQVFAVDTRGHGKSPPRNKASVISAVCRRPARFL